jgi:hypothetical protein
MKIIREECEQCTGKKEGKSNVKLQKCAYVPNEVLRHQIS